MQAHAEFVTPEPLCTISVIKYVYKLNPTHGMERIVVSEK